MVRRGWVLALLAAVIGVRAATETESSRIMPGKFIVEFEDDHDESTFFSTLGRGAEKTMDLKFKLFRGASIKFHDPEKARDAATTLAAMPQVKRVWPVRRYRLPDHQVHWSGEPSVDQVTKRAAEDVFSPHVMTQVDKLREKGVTGQGIKVAIIDSGVDYKHPALGGCFGPGCLVSFGYDFVGDAFNGTNDPVPDSDPMDCGGHGTHVSGIIAAQANNPYGITGAAPGVELGMFRVFGCDGEVGDDILISAYNRAYEAGADLITASLGGASGWTEEPWAVVVTRIVENGVPCTISAGNDGSYGLFYAASAANGKKVTAIASVDNVRSPQLLTQATFTTNSSANSSFSYTAGSPAEWGGVTLPLWAVNFNTTDDANGCDPYPDSTPDLSGYIVLVRRGTCLFTQKIENALKKGSKYVIVYNNVQDPVMIDADAVNGTKGVAMVSPEVGEAWISSLSKGSKVVVAMTDPMTAPRSLVNDFNNATGGFMSSYTSWGPTFEIDVKPQLAAPGGQILSTWPTAKGSYSVLSGTSMACPLSAAIYALVMQARGTKDPKTIENVLSATSKPIKFRGGAFSYPFLAPVPQQGSGLIQAYDAAMATTLLSESSLSFNDSANHVALQNFTISNEGKTSVIYTLGHVGAATAYTFSNETSIVAASFPNEMVVKPATLEFNITGTSITIPAGQRRIISVSARPPDVSAKRLPVYSGYVTVNGSDGSALSLPYLGVVGNMRNVTVLDPRSYLSNSLSKNMTRSLPDETFILPPAGHVNDTEWRNRTGLPLLNAQLVMGSPLLRADLVPIKICGNRTTTDILGVKSLGPLDNYPLPYMARNDPVHTKWDGKLADGTYAPAGTYKILVRALHIFADPNEASDYDSVETVPFKIRYYKGSGMWRRQALECDDVVRRSV